MAMGLEGIALSRKSIIREIRKNTGGEGRESNPARVKMTVVKCNKINNLDGVRHLRFIAFWATVAHFFNTPLIAVPSRLIKLGIHFR
jgi:hypothetical protein